jgi:hypothetical protein
MVQKPLLQELFLFVSFESHSHLHLLKIQFYFWSPLIGQCQKHVIPVVKYLLLVRRRYRVALAFFVSRPIPYRVCLDYFKNEIIEPVGWLLVAK